MEALPRVSVIVPTRDRGPVLLGCVLSLLAQQAAPDFEVVVVDDGSVDRTGELLSTLVATSTVPVRMERLPGLGPNAARNAGVRAARGEWLCFVDDDEVVPPDHLHRVDARLARDKDIDALGGPVREVAATGFRICSRCSLGTIELPESERARPWRLLAGNMVVRRQLFEEFGSFDESLRGIGEESEWFHRLPQARIVYDPGIWLWHRKDHLSLTAALRGHYLAGRNIPWYWARTGRRSRPSLRRGLVSLGHAVVRRCWKGGLTAAREAGHAVGAARLARSGAGRGA